MAEMPPHMKDLSLLSGRMFGQIRYVKFFKNGWTKDGSEKLKLLIGQPSMKCKEQGFYNQTPVCWTKTMKTTPFLKELSRLNNKFVKIVLFLTNLISYLYHF